MGQALEAPFVLLKTQALALFGWGMVRLLFGIATAALVLPMFAAIPLGDFTSEADMQAMAVAFAPIDRVVGPLNLLGLLLSVIVWTAAMRAAAAPRGTKDRFIFLRLGMEEVYVAIILVILVIGLYAGTFALTLLGALITFILWQFSEITAVLVAFAYAAVAIGLLLWLTARVSLIAAASRVLKTVAFEQGWKLGKGQGWKLAGTGFLAWLILIVLSIVIGGLVIGLFFGVAAVMGVRLPGPDSIHSFADLTEVGRPFLIPGLVLAIPLALFDGFSHAVFAAPLASACRQLMDDGETPVQANGGDGDPAPAL